MAQRLRNGPSMAVIAPLLAFLGRQLGRLVQMVFGWAAILLFGRVPQSKQMLLTGVTFGSVIWVVTLIGILVPDIGAFLIALVPAPDAVKEDWIRLAMIVLAILLPLGIGVAGLFLMDADDRPSGIGGKAVQVLRGYPYAAVLALVLLFLIVVAPIYKLRTIVKRWSDAHVPIVIQPGGYDEVADQVEGALDAAGLDLSPRRAPKALEAPSRLLAAVGGASVRRLVPDQLLMLASAELEVVLHPSDVAIAGTKQAVAGARAAIADRLVETEAHLTISAEAQVIEDALRAARKGTTKQSIPAVLDAIDQQLARLVVPFEEWEVLYRQRLQLERDLLRSQLDARGDQGAADDDEGILARVAGAIGNIGS